MCDIIGLQEVRNMIIRETYLKKIRPFIGGELIKVMTGIRRSGKSVMLEMIAKELIDSGISKENLITINFENMRYSHLLTAQALHDEISNRIQNIEGKVYQFISSRI